MLYAIVALLVIVLDQWTKLWIFTNVGEHDTRVLFDGFVSLANVKNEGGAFSFLADMNVTVVFIAAAGVVALLTIILLATNLVKGGLGRWSLVFIAAGGLSNAIDRLLNDGAVLDMIKLDFLAKRGINFPYFNVADIFITVFSFLLILYILFGGRRKAAVEEDEEEEEEDEAPEEELPDDEEEDQPRRKSRRERRKEAEPEAEPEEEQPRKKNRQSYEEDYERYKARKSQEQPAEAPAAPKVDPEDPFAEWERANQKQVEAASAPAPAPAPAPVEEAPAPAPAPVEEAPRPRKAAPRPAPEPAPAPEEFSLDDILAEFK
ncbi:MAG: signal peptidase II [Oscillospiraceae bacterium]|nr:signal peptidase II [Oscillospiraceae bacterium]